MNFVAYNYFKNAIACSKLKHSKVKEVYSSRMQSFKFKYKTWQQEYTFYIIYQGQYVAYYVKDLSKQRRIRVNCENDYYREVEEAFIECAKIIKSNITCEQLKIQD